MQGVYFRHSTRAQAERLGLHGFVRNLADGSVEVMARGPAASLDSFRLWLQHGPELARVDAVQAWELGDEAGSQLPADFKIF